MKNAIFAAVVFAHAAPAFADETKPAEAKPAAAEAKHKGHKKHEMKGEKKGEMKADKKDDKAAAPAPAAK